MPEQPVAAAPWDYTITRLDNLQNIRVQIKGTNCVRKDAKRFHITVKSGRTKTQRIDPDVVHVLACYVEPLKVWYNLPTTALKGKSVWLYPENNTSSGQYECWRHDWSVFRF